MTFLQRLKVCSPRSACGLALLPSESASTTWRHATRTCPTSMKFVKKLRHCVSLSNTIARDLDKILVRFFSRTFTCLLLRGTVVVAYVVVMATDLQCVASASLSSNSLLLVTTSQQSDHVTYFCWVRIKSPSSNHTNPLQYLHNTYILFCCSLWFSLTQRASTSL